MSTEVIQPLPVARSNAWAGAFAAVYDPFLWLGERAGVRALRRDLLAGARGCTLDLGSGTGLNLPHYRDDLDGIVLTEPDGAMRARLEKRLRRSGRTAHIVDAPAEHLPLPDESVDTVVSTFVLCTVDDPERALREIVRVLRPGGQLLFIEHVRADSPRLAAWQQRLARPWRAFARGCRCDQDTTELIARSGLVLEPVRRHSWRAMPPIVRPLIVGHARREQP